MKKRLFLLLYFFSFSHFLISKPLDLELFAKGAILINADTGAILFEKNAYEKMFPASITKVATALYVLQGNPDLEELITAKQEAIASITPQAKRQSNYRSPSYWLETDGTHMGIKKGEMISLNDLLYGLMLVSANDAANVMAQHLRGNIPDFVEDLNQYLLKLGCKNTHFCNPHGLHHPEHVTTAYDMSLVAREAMKIPLFKKIVSTYKYIVPETNLQQPRTLVQLNHLLRPSSPYFYPKAIGIKTGNHSISGKTLIGAAKNEERNLIAVILGCSSNADRCKDAHALFEAAFKEQKFNRKLLTKGVQNISKQLVGAKKTLIPYVNEDINYQYFPSEEEQLKLLVKWDIPSLPIHSDQKVGLVQVVNAKKVILKEVPLFATEEIKPSLFYQVKTHFWVLMTSALAILALLYLLLSKKKPNRKALF